MCYYLISNYTFSATRFAMSQRAVILLSLCVGILSQLTEDIHDVIRNDVMVDVHQRRNKDNYDNHGHATICGKINQSLFYYCVTYHTYYYTCTIQINHSDKTLQVKRGI